MKKILRKLNLVEEYTFEMNAQLSEVVDKLKRNIDDFDFNIVNLLFEPFNSGNNRFKGKVDLKGFEIKHRREFFNYNISIPIVKGRFIEKNNALVIETEINGLRRGYVLFSGLLFLTIFFLLIIVSSTKFNFLKLAPIFAPFFLGVTLIPYFFIINGIRRMKHEIEREFYFILSK